MSSIWNFLLDSVQTPCLLTGLLFYPVKRGKKGVLPVSWVCFLLSLSLSSQRQKRTCGRALGQVKFLDSAAKCISGQGISCLAPIPGLPSEVSLVFPPISILSALQAGGGTSLPIQDSLQEGRGSESSLLKVCKPGSSYWSFSERSFHSSHPMGAGSLHLHLPVFPFPLPFFPLHLLPLAISSPLVLGTPLEQVDLVFWFSVFTPLKYEI